MKNIIFTLLLFILYCNGTNAQDNFLGFWSDADKTQIIKIYKKDDLYYGDLIYKDKKPLKEIREKVVLLQLRKRNRKMLHEGTYIDHDLDKKYKIELFLKDPRTIVFSAAQDNLNVNKLWHRVP